MKIIQIDFKFSMCQVMKFHDNWGISNATMKSFLNSNPSIQDNLFEKMNFKNILLLRLIYIGWISSSQHYKWNTFIDAQPHVVFGLGDLDLMRYLNNVFEITSYWGEFEI